MRTTILLTTVMTTLALLLALEAGADQLFNTRFGSRGMQRFLERSAAGPRVTPGGDRTVDAGGGHGYMQRQGFGRDPLAAIEDRWGDDAFQPRWYYDYNQNRWLWVDNYSDDQPTRYRLRGPVRYHYYEGGFNENERYFRPFGRANLRYGR